MAGDIGSVSALFKEMIKIDKNTWKKTPEYLNFKIKLQEEV